MASRFLPTSGATKIPLTISVRSCTGTALQAPHPRYPASRVLPGCSPVIRNYCISTPIVGQLAPRLTVYIRHSTGHLISA